MKEKHFEIETLGHIVKVRFNRPHKANALNMEAWLEMKEIFSSSIIDGNARVIILEGSGKNWCAGIDLELLMNFNQFDNSAGEARKRVELRAFILNLQSCINAISSCPVPVIASIQGACIGGGLDIASACDIRYCTEGAFFSIKEIELGLVADLGSLQRLPSILSPGILNELAYTGRKVSGLEAEKIQLVNRCFAERQDMDNYILEIANIIASMSPLAVKGTKEVIRYSAVHSIEDSLRHVANHNAAFLSEVDMMEAFSAKMGKRDPDYKNQ